MKRYQFVFLLLVSVFSMYSNDFIGYVPITAVKPGQLRYTAASVKTKAHAMKKQFDNGNSALDAPGIPAIKGPEDIGYVLVDGHHKFLAAQQVGSSTIPLFLVADLSAMSRAQFYQHAQEKNYVYPVRCKGEKAMLPENGWFEWSQLEDDPNRLFVALTAWKCIKSDGKIVGFKDVNASEDPLYPLWIKKMWKKVEIAFIEFKIATALYQAGIVYRYDMGKNPNSKAVRDLTEQARALLNERPIAGLELIYPQAECDTLVI